MIKSYSAFTEEIDDAKIAVSEILAQLEPKKNCLKNSVALVTCYHEFATNGIIAELYKELGFPVVGFTTTAISTNRGLGQLDLSILMITSDDVTFTAARSESLEGGLEEPLEQMYERALEGHENPPKLLISAAPLMLDYAGDSYVAALDKISGGVPNFGALAIDNTANYLNSYVVFNDTVGRDFYGIIMASGNISPKFLYASFSPEYILKQSATITKSEGNLLKEIDGDPLIKYMENMGLAENGAVSDVLHSIPFILDYSGDGIPVSRVLLSWSEEGYGICGGLMPEGTRFNLGMWDEADVLKTTIKTIEDILKNEDIGALLLYSCLARSYSLGIKILSETEVVSQTVGENVSYIFGYAGGEICPVKDGANANSFHNNTVIACAF
ncbi:MAG: FIST C-terminal domain-containing protein [Oscillospiraceae bacterium]|nr:FIST C-terminal domain-containing protein [Oscillospiraceae bacterium]